MYYYFTLLFIFFRLYFWLLPAQHFHFLYARSHLSESWSCESIISTNFSFIFTLIYPMTQFSLWIVNKWILWLLCKSTYIFVDIDFWVYPKMRISIFTYQRSSWILRGSLCRPLSGMDEIEKLSPISIKYTEIYYLWTLLDSK